MCTGRVDPEMIFRAFLKGADGVFIGGCRLGECNYTTGGNYHARNITLLCKRIMEYIGMNPGRLRMEFMTSGDGILFAGIMNDFGRQVKALGPPGTGEETEKEELESRLAKIAGLVPYLKMKCGEKLDARPETPEAYETLFTTEDIRRLLEEVESFIIDPEKCQACGICARRCPVEAIAGEKKTPHVIDQDKCIRCGTCFEVCPPRFSAIEKQVLPVFG